MKNPNWGSTKLDDRGMNLAIWINLTITNDGSPTHCNSIDLSDGKYTKIYLNHMIFQIIIYWKLQLI